MMNEGEEVEENEGDEKPNSISTSTYFVFRFTHMENLLLLGRRNVTSKMNTS